jgi:hypothetical protein
MENNEKKVPLIWATALLVAGISVIITTVIPALCFWEGAGIFLIGTGVLATLIQLFVGEKGPIGFSLFMTIAGLFLVVKTWLGTLLPDFGTWFWIGIALVIIAVGAIVSIVLKK